MNRKIIIIISVLICLCAALITAQHFANTNTENTTAPTTLSETPQTDAPSENATTEPPTTEISQSNTDKTESSTQTTKAATTVKPNTATTARPNTTTTTKPDTATTTKPSTTTTTKPNATTTAKPTAPTESTSKAEKQTITVTISINCEKALDKVDGLPASGYFLAPCKFTVKKGATVFDVLEAAAKKNGIPLKYQSKSYIQAINGLAEKDCGGGSGWTYKVNGVKPNKSAAKYELADGDIIEWYYVTNPTD